VQQEFFQHNTERDNNATRACRETLQTRDGRISITRKVWVGDCNQRGVESVCFVNSEYRLYFESTCHVARSLFAWFWLVGLGAVGGEVTRLTVSARVYRLSINVKYNMYRSIGCIIYVV
jgi:hypothetical protein